MLIEAVQEAIHRSKAYFLETQHSSGYWIGELESNATITAEYLFFRRLLDCHDPRREQEIAAELLAQQKDGGWSLYYGGPPDLNTTIEAAVALHISGLPWDHPRLQEAIEVVHSLGGMERARVFTRIWLALLGAIPRDTLPSMPPEMILLPRWFPLNIYRFASWARSTIVPLLILLNLPNNYHGFVPEVDRLYCGADYDPLALQAKPGWRNAFLLLDRVLKLCDAPLRSASWRKKALAAACDWLLEHQEVDGGWGGIIPAMVNSTLALDLLNGRCNQVQKGMAAVEGFGIKTPGRFRLQSCISPGWDTPWVMLALQAAGLPPDHKALRCAVEWLSKQQSLLLSDWSLATPGVPPGGWAFEFHNAHYPDTDDTALVLQALHGLDHPLPVEEKRGLEWLLGMQNPDGGWGAFDRCNNTKWPQFIPFCDFGEVLDPSSADVTAHVLETLSKFGLPQDHPAVRRGIKYLWQEQEADGAWYGRWGVNYLYGTAACLQAFQALGWDKQDARLLRAASWLRQHQNGDGGWGESCQSYEDEAWRGRGPSTASQTAWALMGLLSIGTPDDPAVLRGVQWLLAHQESDGTWPEPYFTGTGFPKDFYIKYHEYRNYFPLLALSRFHNQLAMGT